MTTSPPPLPSAPSNSQALNVAVATILVLLSLWTMVADLRFPVDMLLQTSASSVVLALFVGAWLLLSVITAVFPKRVVIAASILVTLRMGLGWPLNHWLGNTTSSQITSVIIFLGSCAYLIASLKHWRVLTNRPGFRLRHFAVMLAFWLIFNVASLIPFGLGMIQGLDNFAGSYVDISIQGVTLKERVFEKDDKRIRLTGMVHIADPSFYKNLAHRIPPVPPERHLVLTEGVSDRDGILPESFASGQTYARLAKKLGLEPQEKPQAQAPALPAPTIPGMTFLNADSDVSELPEKHRELLVKLLTFLDEAELHEMLTMPEGVTAMDIHDLFMIGLLRSRNDHLMGILDQQLAQYDEVHIPWGAAHLPDIEDRLLQRGYRIIEDRNQQAIDFLKRFR